MSRFSKILAIVGVIAGVVLIGAAVGWWMSRTPTSGSDIAVAKAPLLATTETNLLAPAKKKLPGDLRKIKRLKGGTNTSPTQISGATANETAEWETKVDEILLPEGNDAEKVKQLLAMFPTLPEDGQEEVAQHLSNLVADEDYAPLGKLLTDAKLPESVLDVLMADILNRPNAVKLPTLLEVARNPQHTEASEAKDLLELFLDPDEEYGNDWNKWRTKVAQWLKDNPD
jgi:hypothetical protein